MKQLPISAAAAAVLAGAVALGAHVPAVAAALTAIAGWPAPPAPAARRPVTDDYAGTKVVDDYRYFETMTDPAVQALFKKQNAYARAVLSKLEPGRATLLARIAQLDAAGPLVSRVQRDGDAYFYERRDPGENTLRLFTRPVAGGPERVLVDPAKLETAPGQHFTIEYFTPSPDGRYVGYGVSEGGSESATLHVVETKTAKILPDAIDRAKYVGITGWRPDGTSFFYLRFPKLAAGQSQLESELRPVSYLHVLGRDPNDDPEVFGIGFDRNVPMVPTDFPVVITSPTSPYALGYVEHGVQNEVTIYTAPAASITGGAVNWRLVADVKDAVTDADFTGSTVFLKSHADAPTYKILTTSLAAPDVATARVVVAPTADVVESMGIAADGLYVRSRAGGFGRLTRYPIPSATASAAGRTSVTMPYEGAIGSIATDPRVPGAVFDLVSWTTPQRYYAVNATGGVANTGLRPDPAIDTSGYTSSEAFATSADGTKVPISLVYATSFVRDGSRPAYLGGYGSYGITLTPNFLGTRLAWLDQGGVFAVCHPRGGGWFGDAWHRAGMIATKQHTIDDFVACGRYLVDAKYTSPAHLAGEGTSAGGITIGRAITEHPELFAAALDVVGVSDALRSEFTPNGPPNIPEFGSVTSAAQVASLLNMDAYQHVVAGTKYPAVMLITGINDPRVSPWELLKFTTALQSASASGRPVILRVDYDAGHGFLDASRTQAEGLLADQFSFLLWQLGDPLFGAEPQRIVATR